MLNAYIRKDNNHYMFILILFYAMFSISSHVFLCYYIRYYPTLLLLLYQISHK